MLESVIIIAVKLLAWWMDSKANSDQAKKLFFEWCKQAGNDFGSVKLMEYGDKQIKWLSENPWKEST